MNKEFKELLNNFKKLNLPDNEYAIFGSGPMAVRGIRSTYDLDVFITNNLYQELTKKYTETKKGKIEIGNIEIYAPDNALIDNPEEVIKRADTLEELKFICLNDLIVWKKKMARPKDFNDIKLIKDYLNQIKQDSKK